MKCFRCGSTLKPGMDVCMRCGQDVRLYKKIVVTGNAYYNLGLEKARVRDLSGAVFALKTCLGCNKRHIEARNLLGLIYYEMGETVLALREWIISRNYRGQNNLAERYIKDLQASQNHFEAMMQGIEKYNLALKYAQTDGPDLAIIQLKKVLTTNPNLIRAQLLLALLYMKEHSYSKAKKLLNKALAIDKGNATAKRYLEEMQSLEAKTPEVVRPEERPGQKRISRAEVIVPSYSMALSSYLMTALYVVIGIVIGVLALYFVVVPGKEKQYGQQLQDQVAVFENQASEKDAEIAQLNEDIKSLNQDKKDLQDELDVQNANGEAAENTHLSVKQAYDMCLEMAEYYIRGDYASVSNYVDSLEEDTIDSDSYRSLYQVILVDNRQMMFETCYNNATNLYNTSQFAQAASLYECAMKLNPDDPQAVLQCALSYHQAGDREKANELYNQIIENFPDTAQAQTAQTQLEAP